MDLKPEDREDAWLLLAELFFLDTEHSDQVFQTAAESLKRMGVGREDAENILTYEVTPVTGVNLGYLLWPVIGAWDGFDREPLCSKIGREGPLLALSPRSQPISSSSAKGIRKQVAKQQGRYIVGHGFSPFGVEFGLHCPGSTRMVPWSAEY